MIYLALCVGLLTIFAVRYLLEQRRLLRIAGHFSGPKAYPFVGSMLEFAGRDIPGIFQRMVEMHDEYGRDFAVWGTGSELMFVFSSARSVEKVLMAKATQKSDLYTMIEPWLGRGLLISSGEKWFHRRKIITPTFHFKILEGFAEVFNRETGVLVEKLRKHDGKEEFDVYDYVTLLALDSICETSMGVHVNAQQNPNNQYVCDVKRMSELILLRIFSVFSSLKTFYWYLMPKAWEQRRLIKRLHQFTDSVIQKRRKQLQQDKQLGSVEFDLNEADMYSKRKQTFLDLLLNVTVDGKPLSDEDIREEVDTFMFEGHDTTTSGIAFTILQLAKHQHLQQKVYDEIVAILGQGGSKTTPLTYNNLNDFKYLDMVIKESLRLLPPVSFIGRRLLEDTEINGVTIPAGLDVTVPIYIVHRNPDVYPDPERFDPERFAEGSEQQQRRGPYDYIPFSVGSRNCIGQRYAIMELKITIIKLLANYRILPGDKLRDVRFKTDLVLRPAEGIPIKIVTRQ